MVEKKEQIIGQAEELFMRYGIRSMTMDDLARQIGISKKTLYQHFNDKADLVKTVLIGHLRRDQETISRFDKECPNAIDELFEIMKHIGGTLNRIHPSIHFDLEKYYPEAWKSFRDHKNTFIYSCILNNINKGIKNGLYREDFDAEIICRIYASRTDMVFDAELFPIDKFTFRKVYFEMLRYHIRGIATTKGVAYLDEKVQKMKNDQ